jgi:exodeoxyribonuclease VII small subunit
MTPNPSLEAAGPKPTEELSYEQAFEELEMIVATLEGDQSSLDYALALFERGQELARYCTRLLDQAEMKVLELTRNGMSNYIPQD